MGSLDSQARAQDVDSAIDCDTRRFSPAEGDIEGVDVVWREMDQIEREMLSRIVV